MKRFLLAAGLAACALPALAADVGVSVSIGQPGFYGRLDIGNFHRPPQLLYPQPVIIQQAPVVVGRPLYLHVPPGHARNWSKHCHKYGACAQPVYFVDGGWYEREYAPRYREHARARQVEYRGDERGRGRGRDDDHGPGRGNGKGRGHDR